MLEEKPDITNRFAAFETEDELDLNVEPSADKHALSFTPQRKEEQVTLQPRKNCLETYRIPTRVFFREVSGGEVSGRPNI